MKKQTFNIPDGCKTVTFEQVGNQVITTFEPEIKFKEGDFVYSEWENEHAILISNGNYNGENNYIYHHASLCSDNGLSYDFCIGCSSKRTDRLATESERQLLIEALAKEGKMWDADKKAIVDLKYIPKVGDCVKLEGRFSIYYGEINSIDYPYIRIYTAVKKNDLHIHNNFIWLLTDSYCKETKITREDLQAEFNKIGYQYDFETHTANKIKWKPKYGEKYYFVYGSGEISYTIWSSSVYDNERLNIGNYYKTPEEAEPRQKHYLSFKD